MKRGVPNRLMASDNRARKINMRLLPSTVEALEWYPGNISDPLGFGSDPLEFDDLKRQIRYESFCSRYSFQLLFSEVSNGRGTTFENALLFFIDISYRLSST